MAVPEFQTFFRPVLGLALENEVSRQDCIREIPKLLNLTPEDREERTPGGRVTRVADRVTWAITYLVHAGLLKRPRRGIVVATPRGRTVHQKNPDRIDIETLQQFREFREFKDRKKPRKRESNSIRDEDRTPRERIDAAADEMNSALREDLLSRILEASPTFFERLIIDLMLAMGYGGQGSSRHLGKTGDGGVDGVIYQDKLGLDPIFLQAKRYAPGNTVSSETILAFVGALDGQNADKGVFVTTSAFSKEAEGRAEKSQKTLMLIDGEELTRLLVDYDVGVRPLDTIKLKRLDEDFFSDTP